jgi:DNA repair protein RAD5
VKSVVFSQWTAMLDIVGTALRREPGLANFCRLDGGMSLDERQRTLRRFREDRSVRVMLLSLRAASVGLNLTAARRVYLLDPWWNPAVEEQAYSRVHRIGQAHEVVVTRLIVKGSVEEKILELQERKRRLCARALELGADAADAGGEKEAARKLRLADLALCFA